MLFELKNYIGIENDDRDITLLLHLNSSERYFRRICGDDFDFDTDEDVKELLFERCRYADANALELFEVNFKSELIALRMNMAVKKYARSKDTKKTSTTQI